MDYFDALTQRKKKHTCLVLDEQLEIFDIIAVRIAGIASKGQVGRQSRLILNNVGGGVTRAIVNCGAAKKRSGKMGGGKISNSMH